MLEPIFKLLTYEDLQKIEVKIISLYLMYLIGEENSIEKAKAAFERISVYRKDLFEKYSAK